MMQEKIAVVILMATVAIGATVTAGVAHAAQTCKITIGCEFHCETYTCAPTTPPQSASSNANSQAANACTGKPANAYLGSFCLGR